MDRSWWIEEERPRGRWIRVEEAEKGRGVGTDCGRGKRDGGPWEDRWAPTRGYLFKVQSHRKFVLETSVL